MKKIILIVVGVVFFSSCKEEKIEFPEVKTTYKFTQNWDGIDVTKDSFNQIVFTNANGEKQSIERLRYLISRVTLTSNTGISTTMDGYQLVDVSVDSTANFKPINLIPVGTYKLSITFGFNQEDNIDGLYKDLNTATWNVPSMLGGGYHYMQLDGKYLDELDMEANYNFHSIRAVDKTGAEIAFGKTDFIAELGEVKIDGDTNIEIKMNIAEWFKNPHTWNLNELNTMLMPNYNAQKMISDNGKDAFSLGEVKLIDGQ